MNGLRLAALASLAGGIALLAYAAALGDVQVGLFVIIPYVLGSGPLPFFGMLLLMLAATLWFFSHARIAAAPEAGSRAPEREDEPPRAEGTTRARSGGVVLIGPIPLVWGSDRRILPWMVGAGALLLLLGLLLTWRP